MTECDMPCPAGPPQIHRYWFAYPSSDKFKDWLPGYYKQVGISPDLKGERQH